MLPAWTENRHSANKRQQLSPQIFTTTLSTRLKTHRARNKYQGYSFLVHFFSYRFSTRLTGVISLHTSICCPQGRELAHSCHGKWALNPIRALWLCGHPTLICFLHCNRMCACRVISRNFRNPFKDNVSLRHVARGFIEWNHHRLFWRVT